MAPFRGPLDKAAAAEAEVAPQNQDLLGSRVPLLPSPRDRRVSCGWGGWSGGGCRGRGPPGVDCEGVSAAAGGLLLALFSWWLFRHLGSGSASVSCICETGKGIVFYVLTRQV